MAAENDSLDDLLKNISQESESPDTKEKKAASLLKYNQRFGVVKIEFKPEQQLRQNESVSILGEFNQWMPEVMQRYKQT